MPVLKICRAQTVAQLQQVSQLMAEFVAWDAEQTEKAGLDPDEFLSFYHAAANEALPGVFAPPGGCLLLAEHSDRPAGCVAFTSMTAEICEIKRMYVRDEFRGMRIGSKLIRELLSNAKAAGYRTVRLETTAFMQSAIALYSSVGFRACAPYYQIPANFAAVTVFMELDLDPEVAG